MFPIENTRVCWNYRVMQIYPSTISHRSAQTDQEEDIVVWHQFADPIQQNNGISLYLKKLHRKHIYMDSLFENHFHDVIMSTSFLVWKREQTFYYSSTIIMCVYNMGMVSGMAQHVVWYVLALAEMLNLVFLLEHMRVMICFRMHIWVAISISPLHDFCPKIYRINTYSSKCIHKNL